jgi:molybdate transport system substrate-binding protein
MPELVSQFQRDRPGVSIKVTYGSSGNFFAQIAEGAPFDLFFSADQSYPLALIEQKKAAKETLRIYAIGQIVAWVPKESAIRIEELGLKAVLEPAVQKLAIANPRHAPYGRAAIAALQHFGWEEQVRPKLVMAENVAQAAQFVETSAADLGIIALSLAQSPVMAGKGRFWLIPSDSYPALEQASIIPAASSQQKLAEQFQSFVQGPDGQNILRQFGFTLPNP